MWMSIPSVSSLIVASNDINTLANKCQEFIDEIAKIDFKIKELQKRSAYYDNDWEYLIIYVVKGAILTPSKRKFKVVIAQPYKASYDEGDADALLPNQTVLSSSHQNPSIVRHTPKSSKIKKFEYLNSDYMPKISKLFL